MAIDVLSGKQTSMLLAEVVSTRNLLAYGVRTIRTGAFIETTRDPILTMLSIGVEKLYKLTLGVVALEDEGRWPSKAQMKGRGHGVSEMHAVVMGELERRTRGATQYVRGLVADIGADQVVAPVVDTLDVYGRMGRFYYLDHLGDSPQEVNPEDQWQSIEDAALSDPAVATLYAQTLDHLGDARMWEEFLGALNERIAIAVERVWHAIAAAGINRTFGVTGALMGHEVHPDAVGRQ